MIAIFVIIIGEDIKDVFDVKERRGDTGYMKIKLY